MRRRQVDVIVSEWMGYALLFETMLDTVLNARDRWLRPGGAVLPDTATIYVAAGSEASTGLDFWHDVYGFKMPVIHKQARASALKRAIVREVAAADLLSAPQVKGAAGVLAGMLCGLILQRYLCSWDKALDLHRLSGCALSNTNPA